jgi:hypothetical protein
MFFAPGKPCGSAKPLALAIDALMRKLVNPLLALLSSTLNSFRQSVRMVRALENLPSRSPWILQSQCSTNGGFCQLQWHKVTIL